MPILEDLTEEEIETIKQYAKTVKSAEFKEDLCLGTAQLLKNERHLWERQLDSETDIRRLIKQVNDITDFLREVASARESRKNVH